jgi:hypothetical protein
MNTRDAWKKLSATARHGRPGAAPLPTEPPFGFHGRVLARVRRERGLPMELWLRLALRALPLGFAVLVACWLVLPAMPSSGPADLDLADIVLEEVLQ